MFTLTEKVTIILNRFLRAKYK